MYLLIPLLCLPSIAPAAIFYLIHCNRTAKEERFPLALYIILLSISAVLACFIGITWGIDYACRMPAGNLCGLFGFLIAPLCSLVVVSLLAWGMISFGDK